MGHVSRAAQGHLAMLVFSFLIAGSFSLGTRIANDAGPVAINAMRFMIAGLVIGIAALSTTGLKREHFRAPWRFVVLGGVFALYFVLMLEALKTIDPVSASAVFTLTPILTAGFGYLILRQITTPRMALGLSIGGIGALWVIFRADWADFIALDIQRGEIIYFIGCISHAIYTPLVRKLNRGEPPVVFTFGMLLAGIVILTGYGWPELRAIDWATLPTLFWVGLLYLAIFASAATFVLLQFATLRIPSAKVMAYTYLSPSWVILWEVALGGDVPPPMILIGIGLTIIALLILLRDEEAPKVAVAET
ncbi:DMT family transporter [Chachezhania antarctica]|uniref:DMT family transporter n=1 Tax=Chachezhania antarctica TaxID=2340860 RepID=UPI000EB2C326|nr:DMT family transporter [Chachezhania antarctica]|tara:strand:- start:5651 stop:6568 length:918 start_codon:yes stop_codon:yes gene_type:complete